MPTEKPRLTIVLEEDMANRIEDYRYEKRYPSRSAAVVSLIDIGLKEIEKGSRMDDSDPRKNNT